MLKVVWQMVVDGPVHMLSQIALFNFDLAAVGAIPVMVFAYHCHVQAVPIFYELTFDPVLFDCAKMARQRKQREEEEAVRQQRHRVLQGDEDPQHPSTVWNTHRVSDAGTTISEDAPLLPELEPAPVHRTGIEVRAKLAGMARVLAAAYAECTALYLATGIAGYILFPKDAQSNILKNFSPNDHLMQVRRRLSASVFLELCVVT